MPIGTKPSHFEDEDKRQLYEFALRLNALSMSIDDVRERYAKWLDLVETLTETQRIIESLVREIEQRLYGEQTNTTTES